MPQPRGRPLTWRELSEAFVKLTRAVDQALGVDRIPRQAREILTDAQAAAAPVRSRIRLEPPGGGGDPRSASDTKTARRSPGAPSGVLGA